MKLTPDQLEKIRNADASNLIKKVKAGKTLTASERKLLESFSETPLPKDEDLVTTTRLAELFGINRKSIAAWRNERDDIPDKVKGKEPLTEWRAWFAANPSAGHSDRKPRKDRETLLCEKLEVEIEIKRLQRDEEKGELVRANEVREHAQRMYSRVRGEFLKLSSDAPPRVSGLSEAKCQIQLREMIYEILTGLSQETENLFKEE